jgi:aspartate beta-hydroxylase
MNASPLEMEIRGIVQQAERAAAQGRSEEARRLLSQAQSRMPDHPLVLNAAGVQLLNAGDIANARAVLERAIAKDSGNPAFWVNLATAFSGLKLQDDELRALDKALALDPRNVLALLQKAGVVARSGKPKAAARLYLSALQSIPAGTRLPERLRPAIEIAAKAVRENDSALESFLGAKLGELRGRYAREPQDRFDHGIDALLGKRRIYTQQPTFLHFPKVPALEFYPREDFPWLTDIEAGTATIRREFERVFAEDQDRLEPYIAYPEGVPLDQWAELNHSRKWSAFYLWRDGRRVDDHLQRCPETAALLDKAPRVDIPGYAPTAFFSILDAKAKIPPHTGVTNTRLIVHLPLVLPPGCWFRVGSDRREWQSGKAWVFDDTIEHEAANESDVPRAILIFDIWNPYLTGAERDLVREAVQGIREYYRGEEDITAGN